MGLRWLESSCTGTALPALVFNRHRRDAWASVGIGKNSSPGVEKNDPRLFGDITSQAVFRVEANEPTISRVFCLAVTYPDGRDNGQPSSWSAHVDQIFAPASTMTSAARGGLGGQCGDRHAKRLSGVK